MSDSTSSPQIIEHISHSLNYTPFDSKWIPCSARLTVVGCHARGAGALQVYEMNSGKLKLVTETSSNDGIKCSTFGASLFEKRDLATGDYKGQLNVWDLEHLSSGPSFSSNKHKSMINCIDGVGGLNIGHGAPELVTGSRDGHVCVWDIRVNDPVSTLAPAGASASGGSSSSSIRDCWAVAFGNSYNDSERCVVAGYDNGDVKLLDLRTLKLRWETNVGNGVVGLQFDRKDIQMNKLICTTLESTFRLFDMRTFHNKDGYSYLVEKAHKSTVWLGRHLPQNRDCFITTGGNGSLNLYKYTYPSQRSIKDENGIERGVMGQLSLLNSRKVSDQPVVAFDWNSDKEGLCTMVALDQTVKVALVTKLSNI